MAVTHPKGGEIVWSCVKDNIIWKKEECKPIRQHRFDYKLFE